MSNKTVYKAEKEEDFELHNPTIGKFGGGTQPPVYLDSDNNKIPYEETKWFKSKIKKAYEQSKNN